MHELQILVNELSVKEALLRWSGYPLLLNSLGTRDFASPDRSGFALSREDLAVSYPKQVFDTCV